MSFGGEPSLGCSKTTVVKLVIEQEGTHEDLEICLEPYVAVMIDLIISDLLPRYLTSSNQNTTQPVQTRLIDPTTRHHNTQFS